MNLGNFGKVILGQNKEILSLNSGQNRMPEEEYKSLNEVLDFDDFFCSLHRKKKKSKQILSVLERLQYCLNTVTVPSGVVLGCAGADLLLGSGDDLLLGQAEQPHSDFSSLGPSC